MFPYVALAENKPWQPGPYAGVELKILHKNETTGGSTVGVFRKTLETVHVFLSMVRWRTLEGSSPCAWYGEILLDCMMDLVGRSEQNQNVVDVDARFRTWVDLGVAGVNGRDD